MEGYSFTHFEYVGVQVQNDVEHVEGEPGQSEDHHDWD